tara:strand:- start:3 stop:935 length:933 start_codon:yes stop_codon:yes gene_type:complete
MDKETQKKLIKNFPKDVVKDAPKGKFGKYVPHHIYTQRLVDVIPGGYDFTYDEVRGKDNSIIGAKCTLYIKATEQTIQEVGDVDMNAVNRNITESELLKLAVSDGIKRCCMRLGIGLELWTGDTSEEEHYADTTPAPQPKPKPKPKAEEKFLDEDPSDMLNRLRSALEFHEKNPAVRRVVKDISWKDWKKAGKETDVSKWTEQDFDAYLDLFVQHQEAEGPTLMEDLGDVFKQGVIDKSDELKLCPGCNKGDDIEDMRTKKAEAPEGSGIKGLPDFMCQQNNRYNPNKNGCGWGGYIGAKGEKAVPEHWL